MPRRQTHQGLKFPTENILTHTLAKVKIDKLTPEEYTKLSEYAKMQIALGLYDEAFVEQRVYGLLRGRR